MLCAPGERTARCGVSSGCGGAGQPAAAALRALYGETPLVINSIEQIYSHFVVFLLT